MWDESYQDLSIPSPEEVRSTDFGEILFDTVGEEPKRILELGAGSGKFSFALAAAGHEIVAADNNPDVLSALEKRTERVPYDVNVQELDLLNVDAPDDSFDLVFNEGVVEHFLGCDRQQALDEMARVAREEVLVFVPHAQSLWYILVDKKFRSFIPEEEYPFTRNELDHMLSRAGLTVNRQGKAGRGNRQIWAVGRTE